LIWRWCEASLGEHSSARLSAMVIGTHALAHQCLDLSDRTDIDPANKRVMIDTRMRLMGQWNKRDYGESKSIDMTVRQMPDWSKLSPEAKAEVRALLEAEVRNSGYSVPPGPMALSGPGEGQR
jgi:hypothetical protein